MKKIKRFLAIFTMIAMTLSSFAFVSADDGIVTDDLEETVPPSVEVPPMPYTHEDINIPEFDTIENSGDTTGESGGGTPTYGGGTPYNPDMDENDEDTEESENEDKIDIEDKSSDEAAEIVDEYIEENTKSIEREDISSDEVLDIVEDMVEATEKLLEKSDLSKEKMNEVVVKLLDNTISNALDKDDIDVEVAIELVNNVIEKNVKKVIEKDVDGTESNEVKEKVGKVVGKLISKTSSINSNELKVDSTENESNITIEDEKLDEVIERAMKTIEDISKKLETNEMGDISEKIDREITIEVTGDNNEKEKVNVQISNESMQKLSTNKSSLAIKTKGVKFKLPTDFTDFDNPDEDIKISAKDLDDETERNLILKTDKETNGKLNAVGKFYDFDVNTVNNKTKKTSKVTNFKKKISIEMSLEDIKANEEDLEKLGVYVFDEENDKWEYIKTKIDREKEVLSFKAPHFSIYTVMEYDKKFEDIKGHWAEEEIQIMGYKHIAKGIDGANFAPDNTIIRAEFAALVVRSLGLEGEAVNNFVDVDENAWYAHEVALATKWGIVQGVGDNKFAPEQEVSREEIAIMVAKAYEILTGEELETGEITFSDKEEISHWAKDSIGKISNKIVVREYTNNELKPQKKATRAYAIVALKRLLDFE